MKMKLSDFAIGDEFTYTGTENVRRRVTDIGTRVIVFITLDQEDPRNYNGPPYSIVEHTCDEYEIDGIHTLYKGGGDVATLDTSELDLTEFKESDHSTARFNMARNLSND